VDLAHSRKEHKDLFVYSVFEFLDLESQDFWAYRKKSKRSNDDCQSVQERGRVTSRDLP
jgi:hypothetical protein